MQRNLSRDIMVLFRIVRRIGEVAYELHPPNDSKVIMYFMFHTSKGLWVNMLPSPVLPPLDDEGRL